VRVTYDGRCFGCGEHNAEGLQMRFTQESEVSWCDYAVPDRYQSWQGIVHGGMVTLMLDEAIGWAAFHRGQPGVTGRLEVRLRLPLRVGELVRVTGRVDRIRRSLVQATGWIDRKSDSARIADATATLMVSAADILPSPALGPTPQSPDS
jgi:acyl-CoA hydrolase